MATNRPDDSSTQRTPEPDTMLDLAIIGGGPAALSAALYAARAGMRPTVFERSNAGGALAEISYISNYPGFSGPGPELAAKMRDQAVKAGAKIIYGECQKLWHYANYFELTIDDEPIQARTVLVATGRTPKKLPFTPKPPVSYCALCDGPLVEGKHIAVVGGANAAVQESLYLANLASDLTLITHSSLKADAYLMRRLEKAKKSHNITILENIEPIPSLLNTFDHIFVFIGQRPATKFLRPLANSLLVDSTLLDAEGYVRTVATFPTAAAFSPGATQASSILQAATAVQPEYSLDSHVTIIPGLYVAGDVRAGLVKQVVTAAADGAAAATEIINFR